MKMNFIIVFRKAFAISY